MITNKEQLINTKIRTKGKNREIIKYLQGLGITTYCEDNPKNPRYTAEYFLVDDRLDGEVVLEFTNNISWFDAQIETEITVEELLADREYVLIIQPKSTNTVMFMVASEHYGFTNKSGSDKVRAGSYYGVTRDKEIYEVIAPTYGIPVFEYKGDFSNEINDKFKNLTKEVKVENKYTIDKEFILAGHKAACSGWKTKIEEKFPELFPKKTYKYGDIFVDTEEGGEYLLTMVGSHNQMALISIKGYDVGNRQKDPIKVTNHLAVTEEELNQMAGSIYDSLELKQ